MDASGDGLLRALAAGDGALDAYGGAGVVLLDVLSWGPGRGATWLMAKSGPLFYVLVYFRCIQHTSTVNYFLLIYEVKNVVYYCSLHF